MDSKSFPGLEMFPWTLAAAADQASSRCLKLKTAVRRHDTPWRKEAARALPDCQTIPRKNLGCIHDALRTTDSRRTDQSTRMKVWNKTMHHFAETIRKQNPRGLPEENRKKWMRPRAAMAEEHRFVSVVASVMLYHEPRAPEAADVPRIVNSMVTRSKRKPKPDNPEETWAWVGPRYHLQGTKSEFQSSRWLKFRQPSEKDNEAYNRDLARRLSRFHPADVQTQTWSCIHETYPQSRWI